MSAGAVHDALEPGLHLELMRRYANWNPYVLLTLFGRAVWLGPEQYVFGLFVAYGLSGYVVYGWRKTKGQPTSVISTSTDEPDERGLHK